MYVVCDRCKKDFLIQMKETTISDVRITFFECPYCKKKYCVTYQNEQTEQIKQKLKSVNQLLKHNPDNKRLKKEKQRLTKKMKHEEKKIKLMKEIKTWQM